MAKKKKTISKKTSPKKSVKKKPKKSYNSGYNKVRKQLWAKYGSEFSSYKEFIKNDVDAKGKPIKGTSVASQVYQSLKSKGNITIAQIDSEYKSIKKSTQRFDGADEINERLSSSFDYNLLEPNNYWEIGEAVVWDIIPSEVYVDASSILPVPNRVAALNFYEERQRMRFSDWIAWLNNLQLEGVWSKGTVYPAFIFSEVEWDESLGAWITTLSPTTASGGEEDWGWSPEMGGYEIIAPLPEVIKGVDEDIENIDKEFEEIERLLKESSAGTSKETEKIKAQTALEKQKEKTAKAKTKATKEFNKAVKNIQDLLKDGLISKSDAKKMIKELKP